MVAGCRKKASSTVEAFGDALSLFTDGQCKVFHDRAFTFITTIMNIVECATASRPPPPTANVPSPALTVCQPPTGDYCCIFELGSPRQRASLRGTLEVVSSNGSERPYMRYTQAFNNQSPQVLSTSLFRSLWSSKPRSHVYSDTVRILCVHSVGESECRGQPRAPV